MTHFWVKIHVFVLNPATFPNLGYKDACVLRLKRKDESWDPVFEVKIVHIFQLDMEE